MRRKARAAPVQADFGRGIERVGQREDRMAGEAEDVTHARFVQELDDQARDRELHALVSCVGNV